MKAYALVIIGVALLVILYFSYVMLRQWLYGTPTPSPSISPTTRMFISSPVSTISYQTSGAWMSALTPSMGISFLFGLNTVQPSRSIEDEIVVWSLGRKHASDEGNTSPIPAMEVVYRSVGSMLFLRFHTSANGDGDRNGAVGGGTHIIPIGTPPVKKQIAYFIRFHPNRTPVLGAHGVLLEVYVDGMLQETKNLSSPGLSSSGSFVVSIGDKERPTNGLDGEIQALSLWADASGLTETDLQGLAKQTMDTDFDSKQSHTAPCDNIQ